MTTATETKTRERKVMDHGALGDLLATQVKGASFASMVMETVPNWRMPASNPYAKAGIKKRSRLTIVMGMDYTAAVNRRLVKEGKDADFVAVKRPNGIERIAGTPLSRNAAGTKLYLDYAPLKTLSREFIDRNGNVIRDAAILKDIETWIHPHKKNERQGLDTEYRFQQVSLGNITQFIWRDDITLENREPEPNEFLGGAVPLDRREAIVIVIWL